MLVRTDDVPSQEVMRALVEQRASAGRSTSSRLSRRVTFLLQKFSKVLESLVLASSCPHEQLWC